MWPQLSHSLIHLNFNWKALCLFTIYAVTVVDSAERALEVLEMVGYEFGIIILCLLFAS
jgi:hypothetical protein